MYRKTIIQGGLTLLLWLIGYVLICNEHINKNITFQAYIWLATTLSVIAFIFVCLIGIRLVRSA